MRINYKGQNLAIKIAIEDANDVLKAEKFYELVSARPMFNCTQLEPQKIAQIIKDSSLEVEVKFYKPRWRWSSANAYFIKSRPNTIFLNVRKLIRSTPSLSNTMIHEYIHAVDNEYNNLLIDFGHNCDTHSNTAPYEIGNIAESIINGDNEKDVQVSTEFIDIIEDNRIINI